MQPIDLINDGTAILIGFKQVLAWLMMMPFIALNRIRKLQHIHIVNHPLLLLLTHMWLTIDHFRINVRRCRYIYAMAGIGTSIAMQQLCTFISPHDGLQYLLELAVWYCPIFVHIRKCELFDELGVVGLGEWVVYKYRPTFVGCYLFE